MNIVFNRKYGQEISCTNLSIDGYYFLYSTKASLKSKHKIIPIIFLFTFRVDPNPVEIAGKFLGNISLAAGGKPYHSDYMGTVHEVHSLACKENMKN